MAIGRTFKEAFLKGVRSLERRDSPHVGYVNDETLPRKLIIPNAERVHFLHAAFERGWTVDEVYELTCVDPWFLTQLRQIVDAQEELKTDGRGQGETEAGDVEFVFARRLARGEAHGLFRRADRRPDQMR